MTLNLNYSLLKKIILAKGYQWFDEAYKPNIVGVRTSVIQPNIYNDLMFIAWKDKFGKEYFHSYTQTTLPGKYHLNNPNVQQQGCAILVPGQYLNCWIKGTHGKTRPHDALVQFGGPVIVWRDNDKDDIPEFEGPGVHLQKNAWIGLNLHAPWSEEERKFIDKDSAACQVASNSKAHVRFLMNVVDLCIKNKLGYIPKNSDLHIVDEHGKLVNQKLWVYFSYTLLVESDLKLATT